MHLIGRHLHLQRLIDLACKKIHPKRSVSILEVGTGHGYQAISMIDRVFHQNHCRVQYTGYDLFEHFSAEVTQKEAIAARPSFEQETLGHILRSTHRKGFKLSVKLVPGNSLLSLYQEEAEFAYTIFKHDPVPFFSHLIYINGGILGTTIASDFRGIAHAVGMDTIIVLDNLYAGDSIYGAKLLLDILSHESIAPFWRIRILPPQETFPVRNHEDGSVTGVLTVNMVEIRPTARDKDALSHQLLETSRRITEHVRRPKLRSASELVPASVFVLPEGLVTPVVTQLNPVLETRVPEPSVPTLKTVAQVIASFNKPVIFQPVDSIPEPSASVPETPHPEDNEPGVTFALPHEDEESDHALEDSGDRTDVHSPGLRPDRRGDDPGEYSEPVGYPH